MAGHLFEKLAAGAAPSIGRAAQPAVLRNVLRIVDGQLAYLVGAILVMTSRTKQRLGDRVAGTVVVRRSSVTQPVGPLT